jgi:hypothetical protein
LNTNQADRRDPNKPLHRLMTGDIHSVSVADALKKGPMTDQELLDHFDANHIDTTRGGVLWMIVTNMIQRGLVMRLPRQLPISGNKLCLPEMHKKLTSVDVQ